LQLNRELRLIEPPRSVSYEIGLDQSGQQKFFSSVSRFEAFGAARIDRSAQCELRSRQAIVFVRTSTAIIHFVRVASPLLCGQRDCAMEGVYGIARESFERFMYVEMGGIRLSGSDSRRERIACPRPGETGRRDYTR
jgi:hypothetical protein